MRVGFKARVGIQGVLTQADRQPNRQAGRQTDREVGREITQIDRLD